LGFDPAQQRNEAWMLAQRIEISVVAQPRLGILEPLGRARSNSWMARSRSPSWAYPRTATVRCLTACDLTVLARDDFQALGAGRGALAAAIRRQADDRRALLEAGRVEVPASQGRRAKAALARATS
jgi:CRP-like cAMP-binding protein